MALNMFRYGMWEQQALFSDVLHQYLSGLSISHLSGLQRPPKSLRSTTRQNACAADPWWRLSIYALSRGLLTSRQAAKQVTLPHNHTPPCHATPRHITSRMHTHPRDTLNCPYCRLDAVQGGDAQQLEHLAHDAGGGLAQQQAGRLLLRPNHLRDVKGAMPRGRVRERRHTRRRLGLHEKEH